LLVHFPALPQALALLSFVSGVGILLLLTSTTRNLLQPRCETKVSGAWAATLGALMMGSTFVFIRHSATQEVYLLQCLFLVGSAFCIARVVTFPRLLLSGVLAGLALATHNGSLFVLPALGYLAISRPQLPRIRAGAAWLTGLLITGALAVLYILAILPDGVDTTGYLRGIAPTLSTGNAGDPDFLFQSIRATIARLTTNNTPISRTWLATGPLGLTFVQIGVALVGIAMSLARNRRLAFFCMIYVLPYFAYEIAIGRNVDWGVYTVYLLPVVTLGSAVVFERIVVEFRHFSWRGWGFLLLAIAIVVASAVPNVILVKKHWNDVAVDRLDHFSDAAIAALWIKNNTPQHAIVIQSSTEWNINVLPLYSDRLHVMRDRGRFFQFAGFEVPFTPLNIDAFFLVNNATLKRWILEDREIYAFEPAPLGGMDPVLIDPREFEWIPAHTIPLATVAERHRLHASVRDRVAGRHLVLYRARIATP
jgi:hypothetical protein